MTKFLRRLTASLGKADDKEPIEIRKFAEKTTEAQGIAIGNDILITGSWKHPRCFAYNTKTSHLYHQQDLAIYEEFCKYPAGILPAGHCVIHFKHPVNDEDCLISLGGFNRDVGKHFLMLYYKHNESNPAAPLDSEEYEDYAYRRGHRNSRFSRYSIMKSPFGRTSTSSSTIMKYTPRGSAKPNRMSPKIVDETKEEGVEEEKSPSASDTQRIEYNKWFNIFGEEEKNVVHYGGGVRCCIVGKKHNILLIVGGVKRGFDVFVFDIIANQFIGRFKKILPKDPNDEEFLWCYHGIARLDTNTCMIWKDPLCYAMTYDETKRSLDFEKLDKPPSLIGFAFARFKDYILTFGGLNVQTWERTHEIWIYSIKEKKWWRSQTLLPLKLWNSWAILSGDEKSIHVFGGVDEEGNKQNNHWIIQAEAIFKKV